MNEYEFTLRFDVSAAEYGTRGLVELLGESGCDDAVVGIGIPGRIALDFSRRSDSAEDAILSAISDVKRAIPVAVLTEASPDYVSFSDVAEICGKTRQNIRKLLTSAGRSGSPLPFHEGTTTLWHLAPVLAWLRDEKRYSVSSELLEVAEAAMRLNLAATQAGIGAAPSDSMKAAVG